MRRLVAALLVLLLVAVSSPAFAAGPYDGLWQLQQYTVSTGAVTFGLVSAHQNDAFIPTNNFNVLLILVSGNEWDYSLVQLVGNTAYGWLYTPTGYLYGTFTATLTPTTLSGQGVVNGAQTTFSGQRIF